MSDGLFPIIDERPGRPAPGNISPRIRWVPWSVVEPVRERCMQVHDQSLEMLARRGGLSPSELFAHINTPEPFSARRWRRTIEAQTCTPDDWREWLRTLGATG
jgi:hypothetical protein